jgi:hypothetical protein
MALPRSLIERGPPIPEQKKSSKHGNRLGFARGHTGDDGRPTEGCQLELGRGKQPCFFAIGWVQRIVHHPRAHAAHSVRSICTTFHPIHAVTELEPAAGPSIIGDCSRHATTTSRCILAHHVQRRGVSATSRTSRRLVGRGLRSGATPLCSTSRQSTLILQLPKQRELIAHAMHPPQAKTARVAHCIHRWPTCRAIVCSLSLSAVSSSPNRSAVFC